MTFLNFFRVQNHVPFAGIEDKFGVEFSQDFLFVMLDVQLGKNRELGLGCFALAGKKFLQFLFAFLSDLLCDLFKILFFH